MHPFIKKYVTSKIFPYEEWSNFLSIEDKIEAMILKLNKVLNRFNDEKLNEIELDQALSVGHKNSEIFLFFISLGTICLVQKLQIEKARSFVSLGEDIMENNFHPSILSLFYQVKSRYFYAVGDFEGEQKWMNLSLSLLNRDTPRYRSNLINYAYSLARAGKLKELSEIDQSTLKILVDDEDEERRSLILEIYLANCIYQGDHEKGFEVLQDFHKSIKNQITVRYENASFSLHLLAGKKYTPLNTQKEFEEIWRIFECIANDKLKEAKEKIKVIIALEKTNPFIHFISCYLPLHLDLAEKNIAKAKFFLQENSRNGKGHFLDDFFYARIALLENDRLGALQYMNRLLYNIEKYGFQKRLEFEFKFAKELSPYDTYFLLKNSKPNLSQEVTFASEEKSQKNSDKGLELIVGKSALIEKSKLLIRKYAVIHEPVLITGETGTGKELAAQAIHDLGLNASAPFLAINCGALTETLLQSELFGYEAGAFTGAQKEKKGIFEAAGVGTVFLDEFEDVSPKMQSSLLRVLESGEIRLIGGTKTRQISCKIIIASNVDLKELVKQKKFREDLFYRLSRFEIKLPALRDRKDDIGLLIDKFLSNSGKNENLPVIDQSLFQILLKYHWPGNIRELRNAIDRMRILHANKKILGLEEFDFDLLENSSTIKLPVAAEDKSVASSISSNISQSNIDELSEKQRIAQIIKTGFKADSRKEYVKKLFVEHKKLSRRHIVEILRISPLTAANILQSLANEGYVKKITPSKSTKSHFYELIN